MIEFIEVADAIKFRDLVWPVLALDVMPNNMLLGMVDSRHPGDARLPSDRFVIIFQRGALVGAIAQTRLECPVFSDMSPEIARFAWKRWMTDIGWPKTLFGPEKTMTVLLADMQSESPEMTPIVRKMMGYELTLVCMPSRKAEGRMRFAIQADEELLVEWGVLFTIDCGLPEATSPTLHDDIRKRIQSNLANRTCVIWEVNEKPVSMASAARAARFGTSVSWVYTPNDLRGRGYAAHLVAELSQFLLSGGAPRCLLFTDAMNPISNAIYQRIGYRHVCDFLLLEISARHL
ncbi:MAG: GNAT family N-acetyltransferase [Candidatus Ozemobacteraceae bacterium]